jgi:hydrogenase maturation factor HypE
MISDEHRKATGLNHNGVKNSSDMWRTFNGAYYGHFEIEPADEHVKAYREAGVRCRHVRIPSRGVNDLFVHHEDEALAAKVYDDIQQARALKETTDAP